MGVREIINRHIPTDPQAEYDHGAILCLLIAARLYGPTALMNVAQWAHDSGAEILWDIPAEKLNDDRLARSLEALFEQRHSILANISLRVCEEFGVPLSEIHYDPTHILFTGVYANATPRASKVVEDRQRVRSNEELDAAHITKGKATDDAPKGSKMVHAGLCVHVDELGPLPLFGHTIDGNQNGRTGIDEQFALIQKHLRPNKLTMISDRGTFSVGHLLRLKSEGFHAICSVPWREFKELFDEKYNELNWHVASYLSIEQQRRRDAESRLPLEHYEIAVTRHQLTDTVTKQDIDCRVIFVHSSADEKVVKQQRQKQIDKIKTELEKTKKNVARRGPYSDVDRVSRRMSRLFAGKDAAKYFSWEMTELDVKKQKAGSGRGDRPPTHEFKYSYDESKMLEDQGYDGYSAIVTTVPANKGSADSLFTKFKEQTYSELVNKAFKGPLAIRPVFLHKPHRVEALIFLMITALILYYLIQRIYRQNVDDDAPEKEKRTTTRTILNAFNSYALLIRKTRFGNEIQPTRLTPEQIEIIRRLQFKTPAQVLSQLLRPPPTE